MRENFTYGSVRGVEICVYSTRGIQGCPPKNFKGKDRSDESELGTPPRIPPILPGCHDPREIAAKGGLLNQMLLDAGLAEIWG